MYSATGEANNLSSSTSAYPTCRFSLAQIQSATKDFEDELVVGYMPHGTLYHHLHEARTPLNWIQRLKIAIGAGVGLDYLHTGGVVHRDVKSSNVLLDENWAAMISDIGSSKIGPTNQSSSWGYLDPEYFYTGKVTTKTDIYAFGVVLFELLSGRFPANIGYGEEQCSLVKWARKCVREGKLDQMVDPNIRETIAPDCLKGFVEIADLCLLNVLEKQITMTLVVAKLQDLLELQKKYDESDQSSGMMGFLFKIHKYHVPAAKQNSDQSDTNSQTSIERNTNGSSSTDKDGGDKGRMQHQHKKLAAGNVRMFTYGELERATKNFSDDSCLGVRSFVKVYKAPVDRTTFLPSNHKAGLLLVIKRLHPYTFFDLNMLKEYCHPNLLKPIGYCLEGEQLFLTYEFMFCGNFEGRLHTGSIARHALDTKVKIAVGIARGIVYLHEMQLYGTQHEAEVDPYVMTGPVSESLLDRRKILLDALFNPKLSDYDVTKFVHGHCPRVEDFDDDYNYPWCEPYQLRTNLVGFTAVFAEAVTGIPISYREEHRKIDGLLRQHGKESLHLIARLCFETCNEVDAESKMLKMLKEHDRLIRSNPDIKRPRPFSIHV